MSTILNKGHDLFAALQAGDVHALHQLLAPTFIGELTAGLPHGFGRVYEGLESMINEGWGRIGESLDMRPEVEAFIDAGHVLVVRGFYVGRANASGKPIRAAFAHFWLFNGEQFTGVHQVTDSAMWHAALHAD
jgi:ketosteroid isomerase-like protein